ncbi:MAG: 4-hydroxy-3-methylbut-2-enyl diphosphate reductase [Bacteroidetes bacterium]|nr:4-hydroxy-3-methylbut-2-enyl diphosphate reductase [Bacteroidota bacterium]MCL6101591.1 4-hydroxy-3-methylbut-2-enyl diphosphate reductase [Bacteroidota bacterium]
MKIEVDKGSGFCFGVVEAIRRAEERLENDQKLYCLGDIVHNNSEVERLRKKGLTTISHEQFFTMSNTTVLLRAHGEPPEIYKYAQANNIELIDATCPVVLKLQKRILKSYENGAKDNSQVIIYGKKGHAEVNGLVGQTNGDAIVVEGIDDLAQLDYTRPIVLYSQTTKGLDGLHHLTEELKNKTSKVAIKIHDTICRQVANRIPGIKKFAVRFDLVLFVSGKKSSNGKMLFDICSSVNPNTKFISELNEIDPVWLKNIDSVGICGATSTPKQLLEEVAEFLLGMEENTKV